MALTDKVLLNCLGDGQPKPRQDANHAAAKSSTTLRPPTSIGPAARAVEIDGIHFEPGALKGATITIGGGAQWGKTALVLNFLSFLTAIQFANFGYYTPDHELLAKIVDTKFRPDVLDQQPWMAAMIRLGVTKNASGRTVNRKNSFQVSDGQRKAFGHFCGMQKPTTAISLDAAALDEVDDIPSRNIGYVDGRMTGSPLALRWEIGTQRIAGAGQNQRVEAGSFHCHLTPCPKCGAAWNLEENFPQIIRVRENAPLLSDRSAEANVLNVSKVKSVTAHQHTLPQPVESCITPETGHDRGAIYYCACLNCGTELDRDAGRYVAKNPEQIRQARFSIRVSQLGISAISLQEIVGAWYSAMSDPSGEAMAAFYCDRIAMPHAGAAQPLTAAILERARDGGMHHEKGAGTGGDAKEFSTPPVHAGDPDDSAARPYPMSLTRGVHPRFAGCDMGPRCWFWCDEVQSPVVSALVWAEMIASGNMPLRIPFLMEQLGVECVFFDAGGEPDLATRLCLTLNGLENFEPPVMPRAELMRTSLVNIGRNLTWNGRRCVWSGLRAAVVLFTPSEAGGLVQTVGLTQTGRIYPLIKCNRGESIQATVNDFLTPNEGVIETIANGGGLEENTESPAGSCPAASPDSAFRVPRTVIRLHPRARLPKTHIGAGAPQTVLDSHLLNLRRIRHPKTGEETWVNKVENHLGLAKVYARLCARMAGTPPAALFGALNPDRAFTVGNNRWGFRH